MAEEYCFTLSPRIKLYNVIMLGITFMFIFTGYGTVATIEETVLKSYAKEHEKFTGDGYTSLAIIYSVVALANWLAPPIISLIGSKYALFSAGCIYTLYNAMFIQPNVIGLYTVSVLMGFASAVIWTAMGTFLAMNSDDKTMGRNAAIFVTLSQISSVAGSLYVYIAWEGVSSITDIDRIPMIIAFTVVTGFGALLMLLFRSPPKTSTVEETSQSNDENTPLLSEEKDQECATVVPNRSKPSVLTAAWLEFIAAFKLCKSRDMLELSILGAYSGLEISFCAIYATTVGDMLAFGEDSDRLVGLTSTVMGVGEIVGGIALGILDKYAPVEGSAIGVLGVMILHGISYFLIFINTPDNAVWEPTMDIAYIPPNEAMAIVSSLFLGIGDAMVNILIFGLLGLRYSGDSAPAYALFNFVQTIAGAATLYYGTKLGLKWQLLILVTFLIPGTLLYLDVHRRYAKNKQQQEIEKRKSDASKASMEEMTDERLTSQSSRVKFYNIILLGITFMLIFTGYNTTATIEQTVLNSYKEEHADFRGDGFTSLAIVYMVVAVANWFSPSIISIFEPRYSMIMAGIIYTLYIAMLVKPYTIPLYICSVLLGVGSAVLWTASGLFLTINSDETTIGRNSAIFVTLKQCSLLFGSLYVYFSWRGVKTITDAQRIPLMIGLAAASGIGTFFMLFFRLQRTSQTEEFLSGVNENTPLLSSQAHGVNENFENGTHSIINNWNKPSKATLAWLAFRKAISLIQTRDFLQLGVMAIYTGVHIAFITLYLTSIGNTLLFGEDADRLVGIATTAIGVGEILGGITMGIMNSYLTKHGRRSGLMVGMCIHVSAFFLAFLNTPDIATIQKTTTSAYIIPDKIIAIFTAFLLGFGDACYCTQIYAAVGILYSDDSAPAFALLNSLGALFGGTALLYGSHLVLKWQLILYVTLILCGTLCFFDVDLRLQLTQRQKALESSEAE